MNNRLAQFLKAENISQSQFADSIGVARASITHILSGRNRPGFDFIENMARRYPALNLEWFITGKGKMYKSAPEPIRALSENIEGENESISTLTLFDKVKDISNQRNISKILILYDDNTFQELK